MLIKEISYIETADRIELMIGSKEYIIDKSNIGYNSLYEMIHDPNITYNESDIIRVINDDVQVISWISRKLMSSRTFKHINYSISENGDSICFSGKSSITISKKSNEEILDVFKDHIKNNTPIDDLVLFCHKLSKNPDQSAVNRTFLFLQESKLQINDRGNILAYKKVKNDFHDVHSGAMDNSPGNVVKMDRAQCNSDPKITCASGLHFCGKSYLGSFGGSRLVMVEVNPTNITSIPMDHNNAKARCCEYRVVKELSKADALEVKTDPNARLYDIQKVIGSLLESRTIKTLCKLLHMESEVKTIQEILLAKTFVSISKNTQKKFDKIVKAIADWEIKGGKTHD